MMEKAKIWVINSSKKIPFNPRSRYSVIEFEQEYYLIDNDQAWWGYISSIFTWFIPETAMKINLSEEEVDALLLDKEGVRKAEKVTNLVPAIGVLISMTLGPVFLFPMIDYFFNFHFPIFINVLVAFAIIFSMLILKSRLSKSAHQIIDIIGKENLSVTRMVIFPASIGQAIKILFSTVCFFIMALFLFMFLFTENNEMNFMGSLLGVVGLFFVFHPNAFLRMLAEYKIKILDQ